MKYVLALLISVFFVLAPATASADLFTSACTDTTAQSASTCTSRRTDNPISGPNGILLKVTRLIAIVAGMAAVILLIVGGIKFVTSSGDSNGVSSAKHTILYALIGLVIIILAQSIITLIISKL